MTQVVGALGVEGVGGLDFNLRAQAAVGGFLDYRDWRLRGATSGALGLGSGEVCYQGALDWLGYPYEVVRTHRIRFGGGGGFGLCYPLSGGGPRFYPLLEALANLQLQVVPNVVANVTFGVGFPAGISGSVGFVLAY